MKLAVKEPESDALRRYLRERLSLISSAPARTDVLRAVLPVGEAAVAAGRRTLARVDLVRINDGVLGQAGSFVPIELRSLDAIHTCLPPHGLASTWVRSSPTTSG